MTLKSTQKVYNKKKPHFGECGPQLRFSGQPRPLHFVY